MKCQGHVIRVGCQFSSHALLLSTCPNKKKCRFLTSGQVSWSQQAARSNTAQGLT